MRDSTTWDQLQTALSQHDPACDDDPLFITDYPTNEDIKAMAKTCATCPVFDYCDQYKRTGKPKGGNWAVTPKSHRKSNHTMTNGAHQ